MWKLDRAHAPYMLPTCLLSHYAPFPHFHHTFVTTPTSVLPSLPVQGNATTVVGASCPRSVVACKRQEPNVLLMPEAFRK